MRSAHDNDLIARCKKAVARARAIAASMRESDRGRDAVAAEMKKLRKNAERLLRKLETRTALARKRLRSSPKGR